MRSSKGEGRKKGKRERRNKDARERPGEDRGGERLLTSHRFFFRSAPHFLPWPLTPRSRFSRARNPPLLISFQTPTKQAKIASSCWIYLDNYSEGCRKRKWICLPGCDVMWTESAQVNFLPRFFSREVFYRHVVPGQKRENITTRGSREKNLKLRGHYSSRN